MIHYLTTIACEVLWARQARAATKGWRRFTTEDLADWPEHEEYEA